MENKQGVKVLIAGSFLQLFLGIIYVWSVFVMPVSQFYSWDASGVKLMSSYMLSFFVVGILVGGKLQPKIGSEKTVLLGGLMLAGGMLASSFIPAGQVWLMYVTYGIIGGFGVGAGYNTVISAAQKWFPKKRGLATGIGVCAFGFSTVLFAPLIEGLIGSYGVVNTFRILAAAFFIVVVALFKFIKTPQDTGSAASAAVSGKQYTTSEALKTKEFYFITFSMMFLTASYFILNPSFKSLFESAPALGTALVMISGVANALGRLGVPMLSDKIGREKAIIVITLATALCTAFLYFSPNPWIKITLVAVIAFCYGGSSGVYPVLTADYFGIKNVGANYGAIMMGFAASALLFPMIMSLVADLIVKSVILAVVAAVGAVLMMLLMKSKKAADIK